MSVWSPSGSGGVRDDLTMTNLSIGWMNNPTIGNKLFTPLKENVQSGKYNIFGQENMTLEPNGDISAPGAAYNEIPGKKLSKDTFYIQKHGLVTRIPYEELYQNGLFNPVREGTELVTDKVMMTKEYAIWQLATTAANYATGLSTTLSGTAQWNDFSGTSDPILDIKAGRRAMHAKILREPNVAVIPYKVASYLEDHPKILERIKYSQLGVTTPELIARVLGLTEVIVPGLGFLANASSSLSYMWDRDVILAYVDPSVSRNKMTFGHSFEAPLTGKGTTYVSRWEVDEDETLKVRLTHFYDLKFVTLDSSGKNIAGYLIKNAIA